MLLHIELLNNLRNKKVIIITSRCSIYYILILVKKIIFIFHKLRYIKASILWVVLPLLSSWPSLFDTVAVLFIPYPMRISACTMENVNKYIREQYINYLLTTVCGMTFKASENFVFILCFWICFYSLHYGSHCEPTIKKKAYTVYIALFTCSLHFSFFLWMLLLLLRLVFWCNIMEFVGYYLATSICTENIRHLDNRMLAYTTREPDQRINNRNIVDTLYFQTELHNIQINV